jgi:hypothetical protein
MLADTRSAALKAAALHQKLDWRRENALTCRENDEGTKFFLLLTLTKHFLHFF